MQYHFSLWENIYIFQLDKVSDSNIEIKKCQGLHRFPLALGAVVSSSLGISLLLFFYSSTQNLAGQEGVWTGTRALPARYSAWLIGETLAGLPTPFVADLIRLQQERCRMGAVPALGRLTSIIFC